MGTSELISVIVPVYNGASTIDQTLKSIRNQTHQHLEIVIVDDGSTDDTQKVVLDHVRADRRVRLIRQTNAGVAAARNRGIAEAVGDLVAPIDADDLWSEDKLRKQLHALERGGEGIVLVYTWSTIVDEKGNVIEAKPGATDEGDVLPALFFHGNFVGNGSAVLMRKSAVFAAGGYDASLRARSAQGCEDFLLYFRMARLGRFAVVPEYLTMYRESPGSMSSNVRQMLRSMQIVNDEICREYPSMAPRRRANLTHYMVWLYRRALTCGQPRDALFVVAQLARLNPRRAIGALLRTFQPRSSRARG